MKRRAPLRYERRIVLICLAAVIPPAATALLLAFTAGISTKAIWTIVFLVLVSLFVATYVLHEQLVYPLRTLSNLVTALREEDYSLRPRGATRDDALGDVLLELDRLRATIQSRKIEALDATALLRAVLQRSMPRSSRSMMPRTCAWSIAPAKNSSPSPRRR